MVSTLTGFHAQSLMAVSSAISFRLTVGSISAAASTDSPFSVLPFGFPSCRLSTFQACCLFRFCFLSPAVFAFFRPLQFWVMTTQPLFLLFPSLPCFASQWLFRCSDFSFRLPRFSPSVPPGFPCVPSGSKYSASCLFPFILPSFAPTAVPLVLVSVFRLLRFSGLFRFLSSAF